MKKKGFTLIELLAVIVILALIVIIAVPKILDVIEKSERTAWGESAGLMAKAAELKYSEGSITNTERNEIYEFENGDFKSGSPTLTFKGDKPYSGKIVQEKGKTTLALISKNKKWCAIKNTGERIAKVYKIGKEITEENCKIGYTGSSDDNKPEEYTCPDISTYPGKDLTSTEIDSDGYYIKDGYKFNINTTSNEATIVGYTGQTGENIDLVIPKTINNVPITSMGAGVFGNNTYNSITISPNIKDMNYSLSGVTLNKLNLDYAIGLISIDGLSNFEIHSDLRISCSKKLEVIGVIEINDKNTTNLHSLIIENLDNLNEITGFGNKKFVNVTIRNNPKLTTFNVSYIKANGNILIENSPITSISKFAFEYGAPTNITLRNLPELTEIMGNAFLTDSYGDTGKLKNLTLENLPKLEVIKDYAFSGQNVENLNFKGLDSLKTIEEYAFKNNRLSKISFEGMPNIETLGQNAFMYNEITDYDFTKAKKLTELGAGVFVNDYNNTNVVVKNVNFSGLTQNISGNFVDSSDKIINKIDFSNTGEGMNNFISSNLSMGMSKFTEINLQNSNITKIELMNALALTKLDLSGCTKLTSFKMVADNLKSLNLRGATNLTSITMYSANGLEKLVIPEKVTTVSISKNSPSAVTYKCIEIEGDSTRFDDNFKSTFGVEKSSVASTCTFN